MRRRPRKLEVSTFPFMAVLLCAMGSLILVLLVMDRRSKLAAQARVRREAEETAAVLAAKAAALRAEHEGRARERHELLAREEQDLLAQLQSLRDQIETAEREAGKEGADADAIRRRHRAEQASVTRSEQQNAASRADLTQADQKIDASQAARARLAADLARLEQALADLRAARERSRNRYSVVPYRGKQGDGRRPVYVECSGAGATFHPDRAVFSVSRASADDLRDEVERRATTQRAAGLRAAEKRPYLLLLVRPDGILTYYAVLSVLKPVGVDYGYEFIDQDWQLDFPEDDRGPALGPRSPVVAAAPAPRGDRAARPGPAPKPITAGKPAPEATGDTPPGGPGHGTTQAGPPSGAGGGTPPAPWRPAEIGRPAPLPSTITGSPLPPVTPGIVPELPKAATPPLPAPHPAVPSLGAPTGLAPTSPNAGATPPRPGGAGAAGNPDRPPDQDARVPLPGARPGPKEPKATGPNQTTARPPLPGGAKPIDLGPPGSGPAGGAPAEGTGDPDKADGTARGGDKNPLARGASGGRGNSREPPPLRPAQLGDRDYLISVECLTDAVVVYPGGKRLAADAVARVGRDNPLLQTVWQLIVRRQATVRPGQAPYRAQVRFLVRPDGLRTFHLSYPALDGLPAPKWRQNLGADDPVNP